MTASSPRRPQLTAQRRSPGSASPAIDSTPDPLAGLIPQLNHPTRLAILAGLRRAGSVEFRSVRSLLKVSDSVMSKQLGILEIEGFISVEKGFVGKRARTWLSITPQGEQALRQHFSALQAILHLTFTDEDTAGRR